MKFKANKSYTCTHSASCGYTVGKQYTSHKDVDGIVCFAADDGYEDICSMLVSAFAETSQKIAIVQ